MMNREREKIITCTERLVNAIFVVIISELFQFSPQVDCVPD
jgi:hypothetical protein